MGKLGLTPEQLQAISELQIGEILDTLNAMAPEFTVIKVLGEYQQEIELLRARASEKDNLLKTITKERDAALKAIRDKK